MKRKPLHLAPPGESLRWAMEHMPEITSEPLTEKLRQEALQCGGGDVPEAWRQQIGMQGESGQGGDEQGETQTPLTEEEMKIFDEHCQALDDFAKRKGINGETGVQRKVNFEFPIEEHGMDKVIFYQQSNGDWRWSVRAENKRIIAASTEGYRNFEDAHQNFMRLSSLSEEGYSMDVCTGERADELGEEVLALQTDFEKQDELPSEKDSAALFDMSGRVTRPSDPSDLQD